MSTLHDDLARLTAGQPLQPADRTSAVTRKARRMRRNRALVSGAAAVAVLAPVAALAVQHHETTTRYAHTSPAQWPDRSLARDRQVADGALAAYRKRAEADQEQVDAAAPHWLFRGTLPVPDHDDLYLAVFVTRHDGKQVVVTSQTRRRQVDGHGRSAEPAEGSDGLSDWVSEEVPLTPGLDHVGFYAEHQGDAPGAPDPVTMVSVPDERDALFVLADPGARVLDWTQHPLPFALEGTGAVEHQDSGTLTSRNGLFFGEAGRLLGPVTVELADGHGHRRAAGALSATSTPGLARPTVPSVPAGWTQHIGTSGNSERQSDGTWSAPGGFADGSEYPDKPFALQVRCYGGGTMHFALAPTAGGPRLATGSVPCDGQSHEALRHRVPGTGVDVSVLKVDGLVAFQVLGGTVG